MNNSTSELNFKSSSSTTNKNNLIKKRLEKHSVSMYQIQHMVEIRADQQLVDSSSSSSSSSTDKNDSSVISTTATSASRRTFVRNTAGSFDLNVNNLNLNESQSNLKIIIEAQQQQQQQNENSNNLPQQTNDLDTLLPIDSALSTSASALAASSSFNATTNSKSFHLDSPSFTRPNTSLGHDLIESYDNYLYADRLFTSSNSEYTLEYNNDNKLSRSYNEFSNSIISNNKANQISLTNHDEAVSSIDLTSTQQKTDLFDTVDILQADTASEKASKELKNKNKKAKKTSAFAWVGRTVGRRMNKNHYHHHNNHARRHQSPLNNTYSILNTPQTPVTSPADVPVTTSSAPTTINVAKTKRPFKIDWTDSAKQAVHMWSDVNNTQSIDSCYLNEPDALEFHQIKSNYKCESSSKGEAKKRCLICKIVVHETCIDKLQHYVKCRTTYREATARKKSFRDKEYSINNQSSSSNSSLINYHHWICRKYDENNSASKCQACFKSYTNRFGMQTNRTIISCSWCKTSYHMKCFSEDLLKDKCGFGELSPLIVPPSWIVKFSNKNSMRLSHLLKPYHRTSKRVHQQMLDGTSPSRKQSNELNNNETSTLNNNLLSVANAGHQVSFRASSKPFIIRPPASSLCPSFTNLSSKPLLVLINPKSGGKIGPKLLKKFGWHLNARQVFDLTQPGCPRFPLHLYRNVPNLRLLVGGGDGTVGWVLSVIDQINFLISPPAVAVLPLGTGNDMARALNWGGVYTDEPLSKILTKVMESRIVKLDRWKITTELNPDVDASTLNMENDTTVIDKLKNDVMNNYFSLGADAHICLEFHERREANPQKFTSRWFNILNYVESGSKDMIKKSWKDLKDYIKLECDNKSYTELIRSRGYHFIIFLNISKYSGGANPWGSSSSDSNFQAQSMNDGKIEVIGCFSSTLAKIHIGGAGERICQAKHIKLTTSTYIPIQIDGEPAKLAPSIIEIKHKNQAYMLEHVKYNIDSPVTDYNPSIHKSFQVKCILENDYEHLRKLKDPDLVKNKAIHIGTIYTSNLGDNLSQVRHTINALIRDSSSGFTTSKWSFLNGEEFFRINEDSDDAVLCEAVSANGAIFILDEEKNKSDFLFSKVQDDLVDAMKKDDYEDEDDLDDDCENDLSDQQVLEQQKQQQQQQLEINGQMLANKHLYLGEKLRSSQSSPKIFDHQQLVHVHSKTISSSKSTQFISIASKTDQFL